MSRIRFVTLFVFITSISASAQWLQVPLPGTPRTPDGKPNLSAPSPRTADGKPDVSGIWRAVGDRPGTFGGVGQGVSLRTNIAAN